MRAARATLALALFAAAVTTAAKTDPLAAEKAIILAELQPDELAAWFNPRIEATPEQRAELAPIYERESRILVGLFEKYQEEWVQCIWDIEGEYLERQKKVRADMKAEAKLGPAQMNALYPARLELIKSIKRKIVDLNFARTKARIQPTPEQAAKLESILLDDLRKKQSYLEANPPTSVTAGWNTFRHIQEIEDETHGKVEAILDDKQFKEFEKIREEQAKRIKKSLRL